MWGCCLGFWLQGWFSLVKRKHLDQIQGTRFNRRWCECGVNEKEVGGARRRQRRPRSSLWDWRLRLRPGVGQGSESKARRSLSIRQVVGQLRLHLCTEHPRKPTTEQQPAGGGEARTEESYWGGEGEKSSVVLLNIRLLLWFRHHVTSLREDEIHSFIFIFLSGGEQTTLANDWWDCPALPPPPWVRRVGVNR